MTSLGVGMPYGLPAMLKEGYKFFSGVSEAVVKNIEACKALSLITRTSIGPNGEQFAPGCADALRLSKFPDIDLSVFYGISLITAISAL